MDDYAIVTALTNALGNQHFNLDATLQSPKEKIEDMQAKGENTGSLLALANVLPEVVEEVKKQY